MGSSSGIPVKLRLVMDGAAQNHNDSARSFVDLETKARRRCPCATSCQLHALDADGSRLFEIVDDDDFQRLEQCSRKGQSTSSLCSYRVRVLVVGDGHSGSPEAAQSTLKSSRREKGANSPVEPECKRPCHREDAPKNSMLPLPSNNTSPAQQTPVAVGALAISSRSNQSWDDQVLHSIKRTVAKLHFGSRLTPQHLAA